MATFDAISASRRTPGGVSSTMANMNRTMTKKNSTTTMLDAIVGERKRKGWFVIDGKGFRASWQDSQMSWIILFF